jgi:hypothetical protein
VSINGINELKVPTTLVENIFRFDNKSGGVMAYKRFVESLTIINVLKFVNVFSHYIAIFRTFLNTI